MARTRPLNFGERMAAIRAAKKQIQKEQRELDDKFKPIDPLDRQVQASLTMKPLEASAPIPAEGQQITVKVSTAMERAIQSLREKAKGI